MHISDWSSDVCSSDLPSQLCRQRWPPRSAERPPAVGATLPSTCATYSHATWRTRHERARAGIEALQRHTLGSDLGQGEHAAEAGAKIGSASCRERVCQTVQISVVAVTLKKQNQ